MPNTVSESCPFSATLAVLRPSRMSITWPAPNRWPRSCLSRYTADRNFWAAMVPSHASGGDWHVSQLPHAPASSPK